MFYKRISALVIVASLAMSAMPVTAQAQSRDWEDGYSVGLDDGYDVGYEDGYGRGHDDSHESDEAYGYPVDRHDDEPDYYYRSGYGVDNEYEDRRPQHPTCRRGDGTGGLVIGALAGGLVGREIARDRTTGAIIAGGIGALAGQALDRGSCR